MTNNLWYDFKLKFFKSGNPALFYIGINTVIFIVVSLLSVICFFSGYPGAIDNFVRDFLAFPSSSTLWLYRFYTLITYQFFHQNFFHILFNMLWLYWMGQLFLEFLKPRQFHFVYLIGGVFGAIFFALIFNTVPVFATSVVNATLIGASASVMAIFAAAATLVPNYQLNLIFIGQVKIKYIFLAYIFLDILGTSSASNNVGGSLAHLGGAFFGFIYIKLLQNGTDLSEIFTKRQKLKVVRNENVKKQDKIINQKEIDAILDKISKSGYDKLSKEEKQTLFNASKN